MNDLAGSTVFEQGRTVLWILLSLGAIGACGQLLQRPQVNRLGITALLLVFSAWLLVAVGNLTVRAAAPEPSRVGLVLFGLVLLSMCAAVLFGVVALARHDRAVHAQGRGQAIAGIALGLLFLFSNGKLILGGVLVALIDPRLTFGQTTRIVKPEFGFALTCPKPWASLEPEAVSEEACVVLKRLDPDQVLMVMSRPTSLRQTDMVASIMARVESDAQITSRNDSTVEIGPVAFTRVASRVRLPVPGGERAYEHWVFERDGFGWLIVAWGATEDAGRLAREVRAIVDTFEVLGSFPSSPTPGPR